VVDCGCMVTPSARRRHASDAAAAALGLLR
jgi:hypothetical protein